MRFIDQRPIEQAFAGLGRTANTPSAVAGSGRAGLAALTLPDFSMLLATPTVATPAAEIVQRHATDTPHHDPQPQTAPQHQDHPNNDHASVVQAAGDPADEGDDEAVLPAHSPSHPANDDQGDEPTPTDEPETNAPTTAAISIEQDDVPAKHQYADTNHARRQEEDIAADDVRSAELAQFPKTDSPDQADPETIGTEQSQEIDSEPAADTGDPELAPARPATAQLEPGPGADDESVTASRSTGLHAGEPAPEESTPATAAGPAQRRDDEQAEKPNRLVVEETQEAETLAEQESAPQDDRRLHPRTRRTSQGTTAAEDSSVSSRKAAAETTSPINANPNSPASPSITTSGGSAAGPTATSLEQPTPTTTQPIAAAATPTRSGASEPGYRGDQPRPGGPAQAVSGNRAEIAARQDATSSRQPLGRGELADRVRMIHRIAKAFTKLGPDGGQVRMRMHPESLGSVMLEMRVKGRQVEARVTAESPAAASLLREQIGDLRQRLEGQGLTVQRLEIDSRDESSQQRGSSQGDGDGQPSQPDSNPGGSPWNRRRGQGQQHPGTNNTAAAQINDQPARSTAPAGRPSNSLDLRL